MTTELTRGARLGLVLFAVVTVGLFGLLSVRFGGPAPAAGTQVRVLVPDAQGLPEHADVLVRGVEIGHVGAIGAAGRSARLRLDLGDDAPALHPDATVRVGAKTPLGESFVDLDPGTRPGRLRGAPRVRDSVQVDEALGVLGPGARRDLRALLRTTGTGLHADDVSATVAQLERATRELRTLGTTLAGQDGDVAATVAASRDVLRELGAHDAAIRGIVADGITTLRAARPAALRDALGRLPGVLAGARATLTAARPLLRDARPVVTDVREASAPLAHALTAAVPAVRDARALTARLPALSTAGTRTLAAARELLPVAGPAARKLGPALANVVPMVRYLAPRANTIAAWFANTAGLGVNGDSKGRWARFFIGFDPATALGVPGADPPGNAYTAPGDAAANRPFEPGDFPRLRALPKPE